MPPSNRSCFTETQPPRSFLPLIRCLLTYRSNECDDSMLRSPLVTNYRTRHGNVGFRGLDPSKPSVMSSNFILSAFLEVMLELEIHQVSSVYQRHFRLSIVLPNNRHGNKSGASH